MGTSKTNDGPGDKTPLLPDWAQGNEDDIPFPDGDEPAPPEDGAPEERPPETTPDDEGMPDRETPPPEREPPPPDNSKPWQQAKSNLTRFTKTGGRRELANAGRSYVRARGGARRAAQNSAAGRAATGRVIGFLSRVVTSGIADALESIGLRDVLGQPVESTLAAIMNKLAPTGAGLDEAAARKAVDLALLSIFEEYGVEADGLERLEEMDAAAVERAFQTVVSEYNFQRWMLELGKRVEEGAVSASEALRLEAIAKECILEATRLDLRDYDILATDWSGAESQRIINDIYAQAYVFLEDL